MPGSHAAAKRRRLQSDEPTTSLPGGWADPIEEQQARQRVEDQLCEVYGMLPQDDPMVLGSVITRRRASVLNAELLTVDWVWNPPPAPRRTSGAKAKRAAPPAADTPSASGTVTFRAFHFKCLSPETKAQDNYSLQTLTRIPYDPLNIELSYLKAMFLSIVYMFWVAVGRPLPAIPVGRTAEIREAFRKKRVLVAGCGGGHLPMALLRTGLFEGEGVTVVEIEPEVFRLAVEDMGFDKEAFSCVTGDGLRCIAEAAESSDAVDKYDVMFCDAYENTDLPDNVAGSNLEGFVQQVHAALAPTGIVVHNHIIENTTVSNKQLKVWRETFRGGCVYLLPVQTTQCVIVASRGLIDGQVSAARIRQAASSLSEAFDIPLQTGFLPRTLTGRR